MKDLLRYKFVMCDATSNVCKPPKKGHMTPGGSNPPPVAGGAGSQPSDNTPPATNPGGSNTGPQEQPQESTNAKSKKTEDSMTHCV